MAPKTTPPCPPLPSSPSPHPSPPCCPPPAAAIAPPPRCPKAQRQTAACVHPAARPRVSTWPTLPAQLNYNPHCREPPIQHRPFRNYVRGTNSCIPIHMQGWTIQQTPSAGPPGNKRDNPVSQHPPPPPPPHLALTLSVACVSAPASSSTCATSTRPAIAATNSGVLPCCGAPPRVSINHPPLAPSSCDYHCQRKVSIWILIYKSSFKLCIRNRDPVFKIGREKDEELRFTYNRVLKFDEAT